MRQYYASLDNGGTVNAGKRIKLTSLAAKHWNNNKPYRDQLFGCSRHFCEFSVKKCCPLLTALVSGSPIIQDGKLVGAVTHVTVNDPTAGYGIFIERMLAAAVTPALQKAA